MTAWRCAFSGLMRALHNCPALADRLSEVAVRLQALESTFRSFEAAVHVRLARLESRLAPLELRARSEAPAVAVPPTANPATAVANRLATMSLTELYAFVQSQRGIPPEVGFCQSTADSENSFQIHAPLLFALDELALFDPYATPMLVRHAFQGLLAHLGLCMHFKSLPNDVQQGSVRRRPRCWWMRLGLPWRCTSARRRAAT